jgi:hypothetical protein
MLYEGLQVNTNQQSKSQTIASPIGGLNGRDALANMPETDAYQMDNIIPGTTTCRMREGCSIHIGDVGSPVESLEVFASSTIQKVLAFAVPNIKDVTVQDVANTLKSDLAGAQVVSTMFATVADSHQWLIITTGADVPMSFDGTAIANLAITGLNEPDVGINYVCNYMGRLFFGMEDTLGFYYLPPGQIQGAAEWFDLGQASKLGGRLQAIATFSQDAGDGPDDYIIFITNRGEYFLFRGMDPGDYNSWEIVGRYRGAEPIGRKCILDYAGDTLILTTEGVMQFSAIQKTSDTRYEATALSSKTGDILLKNNEFRGQWGWSMHLHPTGGLMIVNVPVSNNIAGDHHQFVMNTTTQAWCRFLSKEWNPLCWCQSEKVMYFGRHDGSVRKMGGLFDNLKPIEFNVKQAYNYFKTPKHKLFHWAMFQVRSEAPVVLASRLSVDFMEIVPTTEPNPINEGAGAEWDLSFWDDAIWASGPFTQRWIAAYGNYGVVASHWLQGSIQGASFEWYSTEHVYEEATGLL